MARRPEITDQPPQKRHERDREPVIKPEGKFKRPHKISIRTDRSPEDVTRINPKDMRPILPEMPYIPPA
jgi:hypothetical protein